MGWRTTERADQDVADIEIYGTLTFGRRRAEDYVDDLFASLELLSALPRMAAVREGLPRDMRLYLFRSHQIVYRIDDEDIVVIRVLHASRDIARHL